MASTRLPNFWAPPLGWACFCYVLLLTATALAGQFQGTANSFGKEQCFVLDRFAADSGATYRESDNKKEQELCAISFED